MEHDPEKLDYYQRLGISEDATIGEVEAAYKALRKQFHPDAKPAAYRAYFDHAMKGINEAHAALREPAERRRYDARLARERGTAREERPGGQSSGEAEKAPGKRWGKRRKEQRRTDSSAAKEERRREEQARRAWERISDEELYVSYLVAYRRILSQFTDLMELTRANLAQWPALRLECDEQLAKLLADPPVHVSIEEVRRKHAKAKRTLDRTELRIRRSWEGSLRDFREAIGPVTERLDILEGLTIGLPTRRRDELRSIQESFEREAISLLNPGADGSR